MESVLTRKTAPTPDRLAVLSDAATHWRLALGLLAVCAILEGSLALAGAPALALPLALGLLLYGALGVLGAGLPQLRVARLASIAGVILWSYLGAAALPASLELGVRWGACAVVSGLVAIRLGGLIHDR